MLLGKEHGNVAAIRMSDQCQVIVVGIWLDLLELSDCIQYVLFAALIHPEPTDVERTFLRHQRRIIWQIMLDAGDQITASRKNVREKGILCALDGISVANDRYGERGHSCTRLKLGVPSHCNINDHGPTASGVEQVQCLVPDRQFAECKIATNKDQTQACRDQQSAFHVDSCKRTLAAELLSAAWLSLRKCLTFHLSILSILGMPGNGCSFPRK